MAIGSRQNFSLVDSSMFGCRGEVRIALFSCQDRCSFLCQTETDSTACTTLSPGVLQTYSFSSFWGLQYSPHHHCLFPCASRLLHRLWWPHVPQEMASMLMICLWLFRCLSSPVVQSSGPGTGTMSKTISALKKRPLAAA